jgi:diguanylate cyclase (GGDEF)-like protein
MTFMRLALDLLLGATLAVGFVLAPLVAAHFAAVLLVLMAFRCAWRVALLRLLAALAATTLASVADQVSLRELAVQLPFVYGVSGLVIALAEQVRRSRAASDREYQRAQHLAMFDALTDLPNRTLLRERLTQALALTRRDLGHVALLVMDLDRFKEVNDSFGHHAGDELLRQIGPRLSGLLRETDTVARLGGDEFALLLPAADTVAAQDVATRVLRALAQPFVIEGQTLDIGASIGIAVAPEQADGADALLQRADIAMYAAKRTLGSFALFESHAEENGAERLALMAELRRAIEHDELVLHYQPIVEARDGRVRAVEALVRWPHAARGLIPPTSFIGLAERSGLIRQLSLWVLHAGLRQAREWHESGLIVPISLNLSMRNLLDPQFPAAVAELLLRSRVDPQLLTLEITEGALMADQDRAARTVGALRELGVRLAIDDFGTGYSSLAYLSRLPVHEVKIDRSFVSKLKEDPGSAAIVRATLELAHTLGFSVVAEGVEDEETRSLLVADGVDALQGYLISRPMPAADVPDWIVRMSPNQRAA